MFQRNQCGFWFAILMACAASMVAQAPKPAPVRGTFTSKAIDVGFGGGMPTDPEIDAALRKVSPQQIQRDIEKLVGFHTRHTLSAADPASIAEGRGIAAAREWIKSEFERYSRECGGCLDVRSDSFLQSVGERVPQQTEIVNVYAVLQGSDPGNSKRMYLVSGHYDSRNSDILDARGSAPGANDDASGTAVVLECARVLSRHKFPASIVFLAVAGEEQGLDGSRHFAEMAKARNWDIEAVLNNDIVGGDRSPGQNPQLVRVFSEGLPAKAEEAELRRIRALGAENDSPSRELARYIVMIGHAYLPETFRPTLVFRPDRFLRGGDHLSFNAQGYAAVRFTEFRENFNHQHQTLRAEGTVEYGDVPEFVDYEYVAKVARLNAATLAALASAPAKPSDVRLLAKQLQDHTTLVWQLSPGGLATGYEVLWRDTSSPTWQHVQDVGNVSRLTLPVSKDNVILAVRVVDKQGHRSLAVVPIPER